jgi:hypothetical protein
MRCAADLKASAASVLEDSGRSEKSLTAGVQVHSLHPRVAAHLRCTGEVFSALLPILATKSFCLCSNIRTVHQGIEWHQTTSHHHSSHCDVEKYSPIPFPHSE